MKLNELNQYSESIIDRQLRCVLTDSILGGMLSIVFVRKR